MAWYHRLWFKQDDEPGDPEEDFEPEDESGRGDRDNAYDPRADQAGITARIRRDAEADAIRHAEDMLDRDFPVVSEAESIAETRLAALRDAYSERRATLTEQIEVVETSMAAAENRVRTTEEALLAKGVPAGQTDLEPLRAKPAIAERVAVAVGVAAAIALILTLLDFQSRIALALAGIAWLVFCVALAVRPGASLEDPAVSALRDTRKKQAEDLAELEEDLVRKRRTLVGLESRTFSLAEHEIKFASKLVSTYESAAFASLPVGVLAEGRNLKEQKPPRIKMPSWASRLAGAE